MTGRDLARLPLARAEFFSGGLVSISPHVGVVVSLGYRHGTFISVQHRKSFSG